MKFNKVAWTALVAGLAVSMSVAPAVAKGGSSKAKVKPTISAAGKTAPKAKATSGAKAKAQAPKAKTAGPAATKKSSATATKGNNKTKPTETGPTDTMLSATRPAEAAPLSKAQQLLAKNTNLRMKLQSRLPRGTDVVAAAAGFRNLGQFVATVNVSNNLGLDFNYLKRAMTGERQMSLGQAIQFVKGLDAPTATTTANTALAQADAEIAASATTTTTTTRKRKVKS